MQSFDRHGKYAFVIAPTIFVYYEWQNALQICSNSVESAQVADF